VERTAKAPETSESFQAVRWAVFPAGNGFLIKEIVAAELRIGLFGVAIIL